MKRGQKISKTAAQSVVVAFMPRSYVPAELKQGALRGLDHHYPIPAVPPAKYPAFVKFYAHAAASDAPLRMHVVVAFRDWQRWFSGGIYRLLERARERGIHADHVWDLCDRPGAAHVAPEVREEFARLVIEEIAGSAHPDSWATLDSVFQARA